MNFTALFVTALLSQVPAQTPAPSTFAINSQKSLLGYTIVHKLHTVHGESKQVEGKALLKSDGTLQVMIRAPILSFLSGDGNRDEHMREVLDATKYPYVIYKGVAKLDNGTGALPPKLDIVLNGELDFHGRKFAEKIPVHIDSNDPMNARATGHFVVSLDRYQVERPSLLLMKIDDTCAIHFDLHVAAGGK